MPRHEPGSAQPASCPVPRWRDGPGRRTASRRLRGVALATLVALGLSVPLPAFGWGRKVSLARKYRPGQKMVYQTNLRTRAEVHSDPPGLKDFLPPVPTEFSLRQQNTLTIEAVRPDGTADIQNRFDQLEVHSDLPERLPEHLRDSARQAQEDFSRRMAGQVVIVHYDREGRLLGFEGAEEVFQQLDASLREPLRQVLRLFLEQMGGHTLYPDHQVKPGEEWKRKLAAPPTDDHPFSMEGESTLHYAGKTRYRGVKAARVDFRFQNVLTPSLEGLRRLGPLVQLEARGLGLEIRIDGQGQGRVLLALDDGRVLQNHATLHQTLHARLKNSGDLPLPASQPIKLEIQSETELEVEGSGK